MRRAPLGRPRDEAGSAPAVQEREADRAGDMARTHGGREEGGSPAILAGQEHAVPDCVPGRARPPGPAVEFHPAGRERPEPEDRAGQRRFPRADRPGHRHDLARLRDEIERRRFRREPGVGQAQDRLGCRQRAAGAPHPRPRGRPSRERGAEIQGALEPARDPAVRSTTTRSAMRRRSPVLCEM